MDEQVLSTTSTGSESSTGGGGASITPSSPTGAPGGSPTPSSAAGSGSQSQSPGQGQGTVDWATAPAHFRTAYETQQAELARWKGLNVEHTVAQTYVERTKAMIGEAYKVGRQLQYSDQDIQDALSQDLVGTLSFLRSAASRAQGQNGQGGQGQGQGQGQGRQAVDPALKAMQDRLAPLEEHTNAAMADAANHAFRGEFDRLVADHYKADAANLPKEVKDLLFDACSEVFKYNDKAMYALKFSRNVAGVADVFRSVEQRFAQAMNAYHMWQLKKGQGAGGGNGNNRPGAPAGGSAGQNGDDPWKNISLDDIATGDDRAVKLIPSMR